MTKAIYALSADPITYGHINVIERAAKIFDHLVVAIGDNPDKKYTFNKEERTFLAQHSLKHLKNVSVTSFEGLLVTFAYENNISVIVRGIRNTQDMEYEYNLHQINDSQDLDIETISLFTKPEQSKISSSSVKALQKEHGDIIDYVPLIVKDHLERRISKQKIIGFTGIMGSGKSYIARELESYSKDKAVKIYNIELDDVAKHILYESTKPSHLKLREELIKHFGTCQKSEMAKILFQSKEKLSIMQELIRKPLLTEISTMLRGKEGIVIINSATLIEHDLLKLINNNLVIVTSNDKERFERLKNFRNIPEDVAKERIQHTLNNQQKIDIVQSIIDKEGYGNLIVFDNSIDSTSNIENLYQQLIDL